MHQIREPKRMRTHQKQSGNMHACHLTYSQLPPSLTKKYPILEKKSGFRGIHKTTNGSFQAQVWNPVQGRLVHQGMFKDKHVAALAAEIAKHEKECLNVEHLARKKIEAAYQAYIVSSKEEGVEISSLLG